MSATIALLAVMAVSGLTPMAGKPAGAIVNGTQAAAGDYPWMTYVRVVGVGACGGTLVAPTWVLTATHCFPMGMLPASGVDVWVAGDQTLNTGGFYAQAVELRTEPKFGCSGDPNCATDATRWDLALLRLDRVVPVAPVRLATVQDLSKVNPGAPARVLGWGLTNEPTPDDPTTPQDESVRTSSPLLRQADVVIGDPALGPTYFPGYNDPNRFDPDLDIIERAGAGDQHACNGDSGGPMLVDAGGGDWRQVANLSWGYCDGDYVNSWNRLISGPHRDWIDGQIRGQYGYLHSPSPASGVVWANRNSSGPTVRNTLKRIGTGVYEIRFPGLASGGGVGHVTAASGSAARCWISGWWAAGNDQVLGVKCGTLTGTPADVAFTAAYGLPLGLSGRYAVEFAQLWAQSPTAPAYEPQRSHVMTSNGRRPRIVRLSPGTYRVSLPGFSSFGVAKISTVGGPRDCVSESVQWTDSGANIVVRCTTPGIGGEATPTDSGFSLTYLRDIGLRNSDEGSWAYALANRPGESFYRPATQVTSAHTSSSVTRSSVGKYQVRLPLMWSDGATAQVSTVTPGVHCHAKAPTADGGDAIVAVSCFTRGVMWLGVGDKATDASFSVMYDAAPEPPMSFSDFDGDGRKDQVVFRPSDQTWHVVNSASGTRWGRQFGSPGDIPVPADYDGDGRTDIGVARRSSGLLHWKWLSSRTNSEKSYTFGAASGDIPVPGDYDGDGRADPAVWTSSTGTWRYLSTRNARASGKLQWGNSGDRVVPGDWDGDGRTDPALFRPSAGRWYTTSSAAGTHDALGVPWGHSTDKLAPADFDGDGSVDHALFRPSNGSWWVTGPSISRQFGEAADIPVAADYDGDGKADIAVWRPRNGTWYRINSTTGTDATGIPLGQSGDIALV